MRFRSGSYADLILSPASGGPRKGKEKRLTGDGREGQPRYTHASTSGARVWVKGGDYFFCVCVCMCVQRDPSTLPEYPKEAPSPLGCLYWAALSCWRRALAEVPQQNKDTNKAIKKPQQGITIQGDCSRHSFQIVS